MRDLPDQPRAHAVQQPPPDDLGGFPSYEGDQVEWFREHRSSPEADDGGCWYFGSRPDRSPASGRFDLAAPEGTCYVAQTEGAAVRERCGRFLAYGLPIPAGHVQGRVVSRVRLPMRLTPLADIATPKAVVFGVTAELGSAPDNYEVATGWADALRVAGFAGIHYAPRFTPGGAETALALFDREGAHPQEGRVAHRSLADAVDELGYRRAATPDSSHCATDDSAPARQ